MKKFIIIIALSIYCTLSPMESPLITLINTPAPNVLRCEFYRIGFTGEQATQLSERIGNKNRIKESFIYNHVQRAVFNADTPNSEERTYKNLMARTKILVDIIKYVSIIHDKKENPIDSIIIGCSAKL
jgi:hypothetical protein